MDEAIVYDDFSIGTTAAISQVVWQGLFYDPVIDNSQISGRLVGLTPFLNAVAVPVFVFESHVFPSFNALAGTKYWLSVQADNVDTTINFGWMSGIGGDGQSVQDFNERIIRNDDRAFALFATAVPETSSLCMLPFVFVLLIKRKSRRGSFSVVATS